MRHLPRLLLNAATAVSLLLCVATAVLWVRSALPPRLPGMLYGESPSSYARCDSLEFAKVDAAADQRPRRRMVLVSSHSGAVHIDAFATTYLAGYGPMPNSATAPFPWRARLTWGQTVYLSPPERGRAAFRLRRQRRPRVQTPSGPVARDDRGVSLPYWAVLPALGTPPALWLRARRRRRRNRLTGLCPTCGYDLRATPGRCPECGTIRAA